MFVRGTVLKINAFRVPVTTIKRYVQCESNKSHLRFSGIIPKRLGIFSPNFTYLICVSIHAGLQNFIQLSLTLTKLCHIKCDHPAYVSTDGGHFEHIMMVALNMA